VRRAGLQEASVRRAGLPGVSGYWAGLQDACAARGLVSILSKWHFATWGFAREASIYLKVWTLIRWKRGVSGWMAEEFRVGWRREFELVGEPIAFYRGNGHQNDDNGFVRHGRVCAAEAVSERSKPCCTK